MCRASWVALFLLGPASVARAAGPVVPPPSPDAHVKLALGHVALLPEADRPYTRYLSFWAVPAPALRDYRRLLSWWVHQLTFETAVSVPREVSGSDGRLVALDLRDYRWNADAWEAVATRDPYTREPWVGFRAAEQLRRETGHRETRPARDGTKPVLALVRADWLLRETLETGRSPAYYDLLFARQRFGDLSWRDGWRFARGTARASGFVDRDFPRDEDDWNAAFGIDLVKAFARKTQIDLDFGAVAAGNRDDPQRGSIVALNNRLIVTLQGPFGGAMKTFDASETAGDKDYSETLIFANRKFRRGQGARAVNDGGELLAYLPNGGQAGLLINAVGKRVEVAATNLANDTADRRPNPGVRNYGSCITCHGGAGGFIVPRDLIQEGLEAGIDRKFRDREQRNRVRGFFLGWQKRVKAYQEPYEDLIARTAEGWTGADVAAAVLDVRHDYDDPVGPEQATRELGVAEPVLKWLAVRVGGKGGSGRNQRAQSLVQGSLVPRVAFEKDLYPQLGLLLAAHRGDEDFQALFDKVTVPVPVRK